MQLPEVRSNRISYELGVSLRQLQWWHEANLVSPQIIGHARHYNPQQTAEAAVVSALRRKGLSLQAIRRSLKTIRRDLQESCDSIAAGEDIYILMAANGMHAVCTPEGEDIADLATTSQGPIFAVRIGAELRRLWFTRQPKEKGRR